MLSKPLSGWAASLCSASVNRPLLSGLSNQAMSCSTVISFSLPRASAQVVQAERIGPQVLAEAVVRFPLHGIEKLVAGGFVRELRVVNFIKIRAVLQVAFGFAGGGCEGAVTEDLTYTKVPILRGSLPMNLGLQASSTLPSSQC